MAYDALLVLSFGGPEGPDDVLPFLRNVTRGRDVPDERLQIVAEQYRLFGGRSPINDQCRALTAAVDGELRSNGIDLPVYWGNRNWHPFVTDTVATMTSDGVSDALVFATSAFGSYSGCRQYREDLDRAAAAAGPGAPTLTKLRLFYNHPGFIEPMAASLRQELASRPHDAPRIVFTAHSLPLGMAAGCDYVEQLHEAASLVVGAAGLATGRYDLAFQSRSGPPHVPWLEPDINDHLAAVHRSGGRDVIVVPIGFVSDHVEVLFDLDIQATATAGELGLAITRVPTVGTHPSFVTMVRQLVEERLDDRPRLHLGSAGPWPDDCPAGHCPRPTGRRPPPPRPATPGQRRDRSVS
jgi:ferrochelatase